MIWQEPRRAQSSHRSRGAGRASAWPGSSSARAEEGSRGLRWGNRRVEAAERGSEGTKARGQRLAWLLAQRPLRLQTQT